MVRKNEYNSTNGLIQVRLLGNSQKRMKNENSNQNGGPPVGVRSTMQETFFSQPDKRVRHVYLKKN